MKKSIPILQERWALFLNNCEIVPEESLCVNRINHGLANFFCKRSDIKYYGLYMPYDLCHNHPNSTVLK